MHLVYRRERKDMPALVEEVEATEEEGIHFNLGTRRWRRRRISAEEERVIFHYLTAPLQVIGSEGRVVGLMCQKLRLQDEKGKSVFDVSARKTSFPIQGSEFILDADIVVAAIGQKVDQPSLDKWGIRQHRNGTIEVNPRSFMTTRTGVFAVGDVVSGPASIVEAVGQANKAARAIDRFLKGLPLPEPPSLMERPPAQKYEMSDEDAERPRAKASILSPETRVYDFREVNLGFPSECVAKAEAKRCLRCDLEER